MVRRCNDPSHPAYHRYNDKGIIICEQWVNDPREFITYVETTLGPRPEGMTIDRTDNDGNYEPGNIRWGTKKTQANNRSKARIEHLPARCKSGYKWVYEASPGYWYGKFLHKSVEYKTSFYNTPEEASQAVVALRSTIVV